MNICIVYDCEYPWDIRIEKISECLIKNSNNVFLISRNFNQDKTYEINNKLNIYRLPTCKNHFINKLINSTLFFNPFWLYKIYRIVTYNKCNIIIVRDLPLAIAGIIIGRIKQIKVILDFAEPYPLTVRQRHLYGKRKIYHWITRNYFIANFVEKITIKKADHLITVCDEAKKRLLNKNIKDNKASVIQNVPELNWIKRSKKSNKWIFDHTVFNVLYIGKVSGARGIDTAIKAMSIVNQTEKKVSLTIIGDGKLLEDMKRLTSALNLNECVKFLGWIEHDSLSYYISSCNLGLLPFYNTRHMNHTIANKLFDFMSLGIPVLCSDVLPMKRIIHETQAGYVFKAQNHFDLSEKIIQIKNELITKFDGEITQKFIQSKYNWQIECLKLNNILNNL